MRPAMRSTLMTSPMSQLDFAARLAFFALAPLAIVPVAMLFPVTGTLVSVGIALTVILAGESMRRLAGKSKWVKRFIARELAMEEHYQRRPPKRFLYYVFYPLLFPYWLINADARKEFWFYKGYTLVGVAVLVGSSVLQYFLRWPPELGFRQFLPVLAISLVVEAFLVLSLLMPIVTTVVWLHKSYRRGRLLALLIAALLSTSVALVRVLQKRDPIVSFSSRYRVRERSAAAPAKARMAQLAALQIAWKELHDHPRSVEGDGKVEGEPLELARTTLERFYRPDESYAFDLWASPRRSPRVLVLFFEARQRKPAIWIALVNGKEVTDPQQLPAGAFAAMKQAARN
jgi:hypothetical protein